MQCNLSRLLRILGIIRSRVRRWIPSLIGRERILFIKLDGIGDVILATPILRELHRIYPGAEITVLVNRAAAALFECCPYVNRVETYEPCSEKTRSREAEKLAAQWRAARLNWRGYDLAVLPRSGLDYYNGYHFLFESGAANVVAHEATFLAVKESYLSRLEQSIAKTVPIVPSGHEVERNLAALQLLGASPSSKDLELCLCSGDRDRAAGWLRQASEAKDVIAFGIGATSPDRCWPTEHFAALADILAEKYDLLAILIGHGESDKHKALEILERTKSKRVVSAVNVFTIRETAALLERTRLFIGNDSGPMHIAAAVRVPIVEISGARVGANVEMGTAPERFGPWLVPAHIVRPLRSGTLENDWEEALDINAVTIEDVARAAVALLE